MEIFSYTGDTAGAQPGARKGHRGTVCSMSGRMSLPGRELRVVILTPRNSIRHREQFGRSTEDENQGRWGLMNHLIGD